MKKAGSMQYTAHVEDSPLHHSLPALEAGGTLAPTHANVDPEALKRRASEIQSGPLI